MTDFPKTIVVGVGADAGTGAATCRRAAREGHHVFVAGRTKDRIERVAASLEAEGGRATAVPTDATLEGDVVRLFDRAAQIPGPLDLVVYNAGNNRFGNLIEMEAEFFEDVWRLCCLGGFLVGREAARRMLPQGRGTVIFTGATASIKGRPPFAAFASAKAGLRSLSQSMARDFGPQGLHVAHVVIDGAIDGAQLNERFPQFKKQKGENGMLHPDAIADTFWHLHSQHPSAWTQEVDLRPFKENF